MASTPRRMHTLTLLSDPAVTISVVNPTSSLIAGLPLLSLYPPLLFIFWARFGDSPFESSLRKSLSTVLDNTFRTFLGVMLCFPGSGTSYSPNVRSKPHFTHP